MQNTNSDQAAPSSSSSTPNPTPTPNPTSTPNSTNLLATLLQLIISMALSRRTLSKPQVDEGEEDVSTTPISTTPSSVVQEGGEPEEGDADVNEENALNSSVDDGETQSGLDGSNAFKPDGDVASSADPGQNDLENGIPTEKPVQSEHSTASPVSIPTNKMISSCSSSLYLPCIPLPTTSSPSLGQLALPNPHPLPTVLYAFENDSESQTELESVAAAAPILPTVSRFPSPDPRLYAFDEVQETDELVEVESSPGDNAPTTTTTLISLDSPTSPSRSSDGSNSNMDLSLMSDCSTVGSDDTEVDELVDIQLSNSAPVVASGDRIIANFEEMGIHPAGGGGQRSDIEKEGPFGGGLGILGVARKKESQIVFLRENDPRAFGRDVGNRRVSELRRQDPWVSESGRWDESLSGGRQTFRKNGIAVDNEAYRASWNWKRDIRRSVILEEDEHVGEEPVETVSEEALGAVLAAYDSDEVLGGYHVNELTPILEGEGEREEEMVEEEESTSGSSYSDEGEPEGVEAELLMARPPTPYSKGSGRRQRRDQRHHSSFIPGHPENQQQLPPPRRSFTPNPHSRGCIPGVRSKAQSKENVGSLSCSSSSSSSASSGARHPGSRQAMGEVRIGKVPGVHVEREKGFLDATISSRRKMQNSGLGLGSGGGIARVWRV
ncbi:hypothetical protein BDN72DRAFT_899705 [Pluteus cervinus]|uniref:Uncharacterized protein n=1 Tax=Pluteus cervinus TaxID=181527 RepID=A0ACD3ANX1_9AGAR|nr:hypothetical protein BDN72DRAFT_899705 [Pluteus cervinus]